MADLTVTNSFGDPRTFADCRFETEEDEFGTDKKLSIYNADGDIVYLYNEGAWAEVEVDRGEG